MKSRKLEVLRSDVTMKRCLGQIIEIAQTQSQTATSSDSSSGDVLQRVVDSVAKCEDINVSEDKISVTLEKLNIKNTEVDCLIADKASDDPTMSAGAYLSCEKVTKRHPSLDNIMSEDYVSSIKNNAPLQNDFNDIVRGDVIRVDRGDSLYEAEFSQEDVSAMMNGAFQLPNSKDVYGSVILKSSSSDNRKITNGFAGKNLSEGATLSFWVKYNRPLNQQSNHSGLITFIGDYTKHYFDSEGKISGTNYIKNNDMLVCTSDLNVWYREVYHNSLTVSHNLVEHPTYSKTLYRANKQWMHVSLSFTNDMIDVYLNGQKLNPYHVHKGKRLNCKDGFRKSILEFLSSSDTTLFLGLSVDDSKISEAMLFDDITFYDKCISSVDEGRKIYTEALTINIP